MAYRKKILIGDKRLILLFLFFFASYFLYKNITGSVFLKKKERINMVFYGQDTLYYSLSRGDINYFLSLPADGEVLVAGGYGYYRLGALGKLASLEKKPDIFKKVFSSLTSSFVDLYFYPSSSKIYYGQKRLSSIVFPSFSKIFFYKSNGNIIDRLIVFFLFLDQDRRRFKIIIDLPVRKEEGRELINHEEFFKKNQGVFYKKTYRNIKENVQILYTKSYKTAQLISQIIEGEGIRVVDISEISNTKYQISKKENCLVVQDRKEASLVAGDLQNFFGCSFTRGKTEISDTILVLNDLEKEWGVE